MFGFLKNKLKEWVDKAKDNLKPEEKIEETKEELKEEKEEIKKTAEKDKKQETKEEKIKKQKKKIKDKESEKEEIKEELKEESKFEELIEEAKKEEIKETPLEFNPALNKYEPDLGKIRESKKTLEEKEFEITEKIEKEKKQEKVSSLEKSNEDSKIADKSVNKEQEEKKKPGFLKKLFGKKKKEKTEIKEEIEKEPEVVIQKEQKKSFFEKVKKTFTYKISEDDFNKLFEDLEMLLLENNVALEVVEDLKKSLSKKLVGKEIKKNDLENEIKNELKNSLNEIILEPDDPLNAIKTKKEKPFVILFFGINGSGKTTSISKIASLLKENNLSVVLAAADTFRAASIEQISEHAEKLQVPLIKHDYQADPSAVGFDAIRYAKARRIDVVLIDTAGRMHTKTNLLAEMEKICRVTAPDLKIFVAESIAGNDATEQAKTFNEMIGIDGSILSKADIDEKGGTIISVSHATKKPIFYLGIGQTYKDLKLFNKKEYIESLGL